MKISVSKRRTQANDQMLTYALDKVENLEHFFPDGIISVDLVIDSVKDSQIVEIVAHLVRKKIIKATGETEDLQSAVDQAVDKFKVQLIKHKEQLQDKRGNVPEFNEASSQSDQQEERLHRTKVYIRKPMTPDEAILQLESYQKKDFLIFMNVESDQLSVLHRLADDQYELLEPV